MVELASEPRIWIEDTKAATYILHLGWRYSYPDLHVRLSLLHIVRLPETISIFSYQTCIEAFEREGINAEAALSMMLQAVDLTYGCCEEAQRNCKVLLSLSSFGATVVPASQEYGGKYPTPYGPPSQDASVALEQWHYDRIAIFIKQLSTWSRISYLAVETVPLLSEALAVCRAVRRLQRDHEGTFWPKWYISFVFPDGIFPEDDHSPCDIATALFAQQEDETALPNGIGVNCTKMSYLPGIISGYMAALEAIDGNAAPRPFLAVYPDGGLTYDTTTKIWHAPAGSNANDSAATVWAQQLADLGRAAASRRTASGQTVWSEVLLGGCCKAGPEYIRELSRLVDEMSTALDNM